MNHYFFLKITFCITLFLIGICLEKIVAQHILPSPWKIEERPAGFTVGEKIIIAYDSIGKSTGKYLRKKLRKNIEVELVEGSRGDIVFCSNYSGEDIGKEGYALQVSESGIQIKAETEAGLFYGVQSLLQSLPDSLQAGLASNLSGLKIPGIYIIDFPKYKWRSFMLDSGRQYQSPEFIKRYLDYMAMLKMNVFHWHLTEGEGWRIEIMKYPKLVSIGSTVADGREQQGSYSQEVIREIVDYASELHIAIVPEIDVPGHSQAAMIAYPEYTCFGEPPVNIAGFSSVIPCAGNEDTYHFLENTLDEVSGLFPAPYIHLGGDEAQHAQWDRCPRCQRKIREEGLQDSRDLQLYFSKRLATYLKKKNKLAIFWGDVVSEDGTELPENVVIHWWNWRGHKDLALTNAIKRGHPVIANTNYYTYLNFPVTAWRHYKENRTFDLETMYRENPSDITQPDALVLGMGSCLWTDGNVQEYMIDRRVFPRIYALAEQMWSRGHRLSFDEFYDRVKSKYSLLELLDIDYGPALKEKVPKGYKWD